LNRIFRSIAVQKDFRQFGRKAGGLFHAWDQSGRLLAPPQTQQAGSLGGNRLGGKPILWNALQIGEGLGELPATQMQASEFDLGRIIPRRNLDEFFVFFQRGIRLIFSDQGFGEVVARDQ
jgi:hypothetical protein